MLLLASHLDLENREAPPSIQKEFEDGAQSANFVQNVMRGVLESGEEELARKYAELSRSSSSTTQKFNRKMKKLAHGESFQCPECGELFSTVTVKWGAFLQHLRDNHPEAPKPQRSALLMLMRPSSATHQWKVSTRRLLSEVMTRRP